LSAFSIPQGECGTRAFEVASLLFEQEIKRFPGSRYASLPGAVTAISKAVSNEQIAIVWLDTGAADPKNLNFRAIHSFFAFEDSPLQSFAVWQTPGAEFYDEATTKAKIAETIGFTREQGGIEIHIVPQPGAA
jgi:hypothetical protein